MNTNPPTPHGPGRPPRRGTATFELVFAVPVLMIVFTGTISVSWAMMSKSRANTQVRHTAWKKRPAATGTQPLTLPIVANPTAGLVADDAEMDFRVYSWFGGEKTAISKNAVIAGTWDHEEVPEFQGSAPHLGVLRRMAGGGGLQGVNIGGLNAMLRLLSTAINTDFADNAMNAANDARGTAERNRAEAQRQLARARRELAAEEQRLQQLESRREQLEDRLNDLQDQRDPLPAPEGLEDEIDEVENDIREVSGQIDASMNRIREIREALRKAEHGLQQADEMLDSLP